MNKFLSTGLTKLFIYVSIVFACWLIFSPKSNCGKNNPILPPTSVDKQPFDTLKINDSLKIYKQLLFDAMSRDQLINQDSIIAEAIKKGKIKPETIVKWKADIESRKRTILLEDSLSKVLAALGTTIEKLRLTEGLNAQQRAEFERNLAQYEKDKQTLMAMRIKFTDSTKYRYLAGDFGLDGKLNVNKDIVKTEPYVIFGEEKKFLNLGQPTYTVAVGDKNPAVKTESMYSATFKPKAKLEPTIGITALTDGKVVVAGPTLGVKRGIFDLRIGYMIVNTKQ